MPLAPGGSVDLKRFAERLAPLCRMLRDDVSEALSRPESPINAAARDWQAGVYYTPVEVVRAQVRLVDDLLTNRLGRRLGFANSDVITLDPAVGTGTYLLGVIEHALARVGKEQGPGAVPTQASSLARRLYGFEVMVGPYAVSELRASRALTDRGGDLPTEGTGVYLADTLDSPDAEPQQMGTGAAADCRSAQPGD